ncbi:MAG: hypothetical protein HY735_37045 [Verrucomicrobia bacterium]|nr:hypothetical protein [Verrucomicrobiota bacterium]
MKQTLLLLSALALAAIPLPVSAAMVTAAEYFIDTDPGPGNGTAVPASSPGIPSTFLVDIPSAVVSLLPEGVHTLTCRVKDDADNWSIAFSRSFHKETPINISPSVITEAEYFINADPGPGNGTASPTSVAGNSNTLIIDIPPATISALPDGTHTLTCRVKDDVGHWSIAFSRPFYKENPEDLPPALVEFIEMQWYLNGVAASQPVLAKAAAPAREVSLVLQASVAGLTETGTYQFLVTPIDSRGNRGVGVARSVFIEPGTLARPLTVSALRRLPDGSIELSFSGEPGLSYILQASLDLKDWINLQTILPGSSTVQFKDADASAPQRFFRMRTQ